LKVIVTGFVEPVFCETNRGQLKVESDSILTLDFFHITLSAKIRCISGSPRAIKKVFVYSYL